MCVAGFLEQTVKDSQPSSLRYNYDALKDAHYKTFYNNTAYTETNTDGIF